MTFAEQLQAERKRLEMTRIQMAELLDVSTRTIDYWENGKVVPQAVTQEGVLARIAVVPVDPIHAGKTARFMAVVDANKHKAFEAAQSGSGPKEIIDLTPAGTPPGDTVFGTQFKKGWTPITPPPPKKPARRKPKA